MIDLTDPKQIIEYARKFDHYRHQMVMLAESEIIAYTKDIVRLLTNAQHPNRREEDKNGKPE